MTKTLTITQTRAFQMFALEYLRLETEQRETVINELSAYALKYAAMLKGSNGCGEFESSIMSPSFDRYITDCYLYELEEIIREFIIRIHWLR